MNKRKILKIIKSFIPPILFFFIKKIFYKKNKIYPEVGMKYLNFVKEFIYSTGGKIDGFEKRLIQFIKDKNKSFIKINSELLDVFMPNYKDNLFQYYTYQQYYILLNFLMYPFQYSNFNNYLIPYEKAINLLDEINVIDYGCGIPYGLIETLLNKPDKIKSATLIDLDLVHMDFVTFIIKKISPNLNLTVHRLRNTESFPELSDKYNLIIGKDIFEHLKNPEFKLRKLINSSDEKCICFFDFNDRSELIYQHVTIKISFLAKILENDYNFKIIENINELSMFVNFSILD